MLQIPIRLHSHIERAAQHAAAELRYVQSGVNGSGPAVVVLHGLASTGRSLAAATLPLADHGMRVYLPDLLGHGASDDPMGCAYDIEGHLAALRSWLGETSVGGEPVWLVGYSLGALLAIAWAAREPERVRGIIAISAPLFLSEDDARRTLIHGDLMCRLMLRTPWLARPITHILCGAEGLGPRLTAVRRLRRGYLWALKHGYGPRPAPSGEDLASPADVEAGLLCGMEVCWLHSWESMYRSLLRCILEYRAWPDLDVLGERRIPLRFIHGDQDTIAPVERVRLASERGPWPVIEYAGAAHSLAMTHAPALCRALLGYLTFAQAA